MSYEDLYTTFYKTGYLIYVYFILDILKMYASNEDEDWVYLHETPPTNAVRHFLLCLFKFSFFLKVLETAVNLVDDESDSSSSDSSSSSSSSSSISTISDRSASLSSMSSIE